MSKIQVNLVSGGAGFLGSHLIDDLGADSLSAVEIVMEIEKQFGITISDKQVESIIRVKDIVAIVESK